MAINNIADLFQEYSVRCGTTGPVATRAQLRVDYLAWADAHGVSSKYDETGQAYLDDAVSGPFEARTVASWAPVSAAADTVARKLHKRKD